MSIICSRRKKRGNSEKAHEKQGIWKTGIEAEMEGEHIIPGALSSTPLALFNFSRVSGVIAGVMRSTIPISRKSKSTKKKEQA